MPRRQDVALIGFSHDLSFGFFADINRCACRILPVWQRGLRAAFAATPVLAIAVGPVAAAAILLPILIVMDWFGVRSYWRQWHWPIVWPMMLACVPGVAIGWLLFSRLSIAWLSIRLGGLTLILFGYRLLDALRHRQMRAAQPNALGQPGGAVSWIYELFDPCWWPAGGLYLLPLQLSKRVYQLGVHYFLPLGEG